MAELIPLKDGDISNGAISDLIEKLEFFSDFTRLEVGLLADWINAYTAPVGTYIFKEGSTEASLCFLVDGEISVFKETTPNEHLKVADINAGGTIGEMGIVDGQPLSASAIASKDSVVLIMPRSNFEELVASNGSLGVKLLWKISKIISLRLRRTTGLLAEISITQANYQNKNNQ